MKASNSIQFRRVMGCVLALGLLVSNRVVAQPLPPGGGGGGDTNGTSFIVNTNRNYAKYMDHAFTLIDTNTAAVLDTNLYAALLTFPADTNTEPNLQILLRGTNTLLIRANHFDYSAETERDFALLICDKAETPVWKAIDFLGASDSQDGWLVQGTVPNWKVTDPMYFQVSNFARDCNAFFRAIPYHGPEITFLSPQPYDVVSNTIILEVAVQDLTGITNAQFEVTVDGMPARYSLETNNAIVLHTKYNPNGWGNFYLNAVNRARVYNLTNAPDNAKTFFSGSASLPLEFENDTYLLFASDNATPDIGTNYFYFVTDKPQAVTASIYNPETGQTLKSFSGYVPYAATIVLDWNFTGAGGGAYTNDTYAVNFETTDANSNATTITVTNKIDRDRVRLAAGCFITYQWEDPAFVQGQALNSQAATWLQGTLTQLYNDLYKPLSLTQYTVNDIGTNRNHGGCIPFDAWTVGWGYILNVLSNKSLYSDLTIGQAHGSGATIGGGDYLPSTFDPFDLQRWIFGIGDNTHRRLRKSALWTCYNGNLYLTSAGVDYLSWPGACGIRPEGLQVSSLSYKNCGLFFAGGLPQGFNDVELGGEKATAVAAAALDQTWICGRYQYPGGCDPTYSWRFACQATINRFEGMSKAIPSLAGFKKCVYTANQDELLRDNDVSQVKEN